MSDRRLENLETVVRALRNEVRQLRGEIAQMRDAGNLPSNGGVAAEAPTQAATNRSSAPARLDVESQGARADGSAPIGAPAVAPGAISRTERHTRTPTGALPPASESTLRSATFRHRSAAPHIGQPRDREGQLGLEAMIGRYGTLAVAAVLVVMGVGAFVTWAASRIVIGPTMRVALGALAALALALAGRRLAQRGSVAFGSTILALALAVAHVDAWAAGPVLHVVPNAVALGAAALASVGLAALALRERNETLFAVGVGGALLAPFVTGDRESVVPLLLTYGWVVVASALAAARLRAWVPTTYLVATGALLYTGAAIGASGDVLTDALAVGAFPLGCAWAAHLWGSDRYRAHVPLGFVALGAVALLVVTIRDPHLALLALAVVGAASAYVMVESRAASHAQVVAGVLVLPLAFLVCALVAVELAQQRGALIATGWALAAVALAGVSRGRRDVHLAAATFAAFAAIAVALYDRPVDCLVALAVASIAVAYVARAAEAPPVLMPLAIVGAIGILWSHALLAERDPFSYSPFLTRESLGAGAVVAAAFGVRELIRTLHGRAAFPATLAGGALFLWIRAELEHAIRPEVATFSLILYYAVVGIALIAIGRRHAVGELRLAGMGLALYAAAKAVTQASGLTTIGLRVGSYLLVGGFLLAVAYWYRAASIPSADQPADGP
jgi:hypothetical protein